MEQQAEAEASVKQDRIYDWRAVWTTALGPPAAAVLMHIPEYFRYPAATITGTGIIMTIIGALVTATALIALFIGACYDTDDSPSLKHKIILVAAALITTLGILLICRNQLQ